jgi:hypothetical protein
MDNFSVTALARHVSGKLALCPKTGPSPHYRYNFTQVPGRRFANGYDVWVRALDVQHPRHTNKYYLTLVLHDPTLKVRGDDVGSNQELTALSEIDRDLVPALRKLLARFQDVQQCDGCTRLILDSENYCLDCTLLSGVGRKDQTCVICTEETDLYATLPCGHHYHVQCLAGMKPKSCACGDCEQETSLPCPQCRREFSLPLRSEE